MATQVDRDKEGVLYDAFLGWGIGCKNQEIMMQLSRSLVRSHLEYYVQFWLPHYRKGVEAVERVQKRFATILPGLGY